VPNVRAAAAAEYLTFEGDIADPKTAEHGWRGRWSASGRIDTLINNAGRLIAKPFSDYTADDSDHDRQPRAPSARWSVRAPAIVNASTSLVYHPDSDRPAALWSSRRAALEAVARLPAIEYAPRGVRVNSVALAVIKTPDHGPASYSGMEALPAWPAGRDRRRRRRDPSIWNGRRSSPAPPWTSTAARSPDTEATKPARNACRGVALMLRSLATSEPRRSRSSR
jgi:NAD(P)-dependent dehydrogenase (short-subunit alcohol dehydrogenase family)